MLKSSLQRQKAKQKRRTNGGVVHAIAYHLPGRHLVFLVKPSEEHDLRDWRLKFVMEDGKPMDSEQ